MKSDLKPLNDGRTYPGQAFFAATGPMGFTCATCVSLGHLRGQSICLKRNELVVNSPAKRNVPIPTSALACKYYDQSRRKTLSDRMGIR